MNSQNSIYIPPGAFESLGILNINRRGSHYNLPFFLGSQQKLWHYNLCFPGIVDPSNDPELALALQMSLEDQGAGQDPRSANAIVLNSDNQSTKPDEMSTKIIKYSEITDGVNPENLNSDIVIEMHPVSASNAS